MGEIEPYLTRVSQAWKQTISTAEKLCATHDQIDVLYYLAMSEFGVSSNCRLHLFWQTIKDEKRNIVLCFNNSQILNSHHVRVLISPDGVMSTKNMKTGDEVFCDKNKMATWKIDKSLIQPFTKQGISQFSNYEKTEFWCYISDLDITIRPFFPNCRFIFSTNIPGAEKSGICKIPKKQLALFATWYTDPVSNEKVVKLYNISLQNKLKIQTAIIGWKTKTFIARVIKYFGFGKLELEIKPPTLTTPDEQKDLIGYSSTKSAA